MRWKFFLCTLVPPVQFEGAPTWKKNSCVRPWLYQSVLRCCLVCIAQKPLIISRVGISTFVSARWQKLDCAARLCRVSCLVSCWCIELGTREYNLRIATSLTALNWTYIHRYNYNIENCTIGIHCNFYQTMELHRLSIVIALPKPAGL